ncbi:MAG TPA: DNA repair protein RadA [Candidatus Goldiibacteriota bacterium]|nr:DNA repair protein RadA [Candidatus Goldiibacteriota bacterium]HPN63820.1 DNA repair protein RadA [Candidatus Goldiibacteriota bacterium]HRQ43765.1 DNA repair protein RadA [Candidatus Goldiibacteriota bacterium]
MLKKKTVFSCVSCGYQSAKWLGKCPSCNEFNTFQEETEFKGKAGTDYRKFESAPAASPLKDIKAGEEERIQTGIEEADRVFGGGIVKGSLVLMGGEPGVGKSTIALDIADRIAARYGNVLYVSGEESLRQIKMRADRTGIKSESLKVMSETSVEKISDIIEKEKPALAVVDSIQTVYKEEIEGAAGSVNQLRESCAQLLYAAKKSNVPVIIIGHVTKEGTIAGPKMLEHMVDAVLYLEAEKYYQFKVLRAVKNRFGSTNEIGIFDMQSSGIKEVKSPSKLLLDEMKESKSGSGIVTVMEGTRALLLEIQALTVRRSYGNPQRTVTGIDYNRFLLIVAILEKNLDLKLDNCDIFMNVAGGIKIVETAADLGAAAAIYSSHTGRPVSTKSVFLGELGLDGEVRPVRFLEQRLAEAERMGFKTAYVPERSKPAKSKMEIIKIANVSELTKI